MPPRTMITIGLLAGVVLTVGLGASFRKGKPAEVSAVQVELRRLSQAATVPCELEFVQQVQLRPEITAQVTDLLVKEGDTVKSGQVLLRLNAISSNATRAQLEANLRQYLASASANKQEWLNQKKTLNRLEQLFKEGYSTQSQMDSATASEGKAKDDLLASEASVDAVRAQLVQANDIVGKTVIRSPIAGQVASINIKIGETAISTAANVPGSALLVITGGDDIRVRMSVDEIDIGRINRGDPVVVTTVAFPDHPFKATVESIGAKIETAGNSQRAPRYSVSATLSATDGLRLLPDMSCRAEFRSSTDKLRVVIPLGALNYARMQGDTVPALVVHNGILQQRSLKLGLSDTTFQEILSGAQTGEQIVQQNPQTSPVKAGDKVQVRALDAVSAS